MSDATMTAIRVTEDHTTQAIVLLSAPIFGKDKPMGPQVTAIATALAERDAAVWEKAAEWHDVLSDKHHNNAASGQTLSYEELDAELALAACHVQSAVHFRTQAAQIRGKE